MNDQVTRPFAKLVEIDDVGQVLATVTANEDEVTMLLRIDRHGMEIEARYEFPVTPEGQEQAYNALYGLSDAVLAAQGTILAAAADLAQAD